MVDAEIVRTHVLKLCATGLSYYQVADMAGVSRDTVSRFLYGKPSYGQAPTQRMTPRNAAALMAVQPWSLPPGGFVPAVGTLRRLRALVAIGWPVGCIARRLEAHEERLRRLVAGIAGGQVTVSTARRVRAIYDELWDADPVAAGVTRSASTFARRRAQAMGWLSPQAWDDDLIDLPDDALKARVREMAEAMTDRELTRCHTAYATDGDKSPLTVAGDREYKRRYARRRVAS
ncbi:MAG: helix-turn-helix domain-containing protein [Gemmatimonadaceae bacterium]